MAAIISLGSCCQHSEPATVEADPLRDPIAARKLIHSLEIPTTSEGLLHRINENDAVAVRLFIACGWDPTQRIQNRSLAGHAVTAGSKAVLDALLERDPRSIDRPADDSGATLLILAIKSNSLEMVEHLLSKSPDVLIADDSNHCALSYTVDHRLGLEGNRLGALRSRLVPSATESSVPNWKRQYALDGAVLRAGFSGTPSDIRDLVAMGGSADTKNSADWPTINLAAQRGALDVVAALMAAGAKTDFVDSTGKRLMHHAVQRFAANRLAALAPSPPISDLIVIVKLLRTEGVDIYAKDSDGKTFLDSLNEQDRKRVESELQ